LGQIILNAKVALAVAKFAASVVHIGGAPWLANISMNFRKKLKWPNVIFTGFGEDDSWKKPEVKNLASPFKQQRQHEAFLCSFYELCNLTWLPGN
jgi:hypothetical protein